MLTISLPPCSTDRRCKRQHTLAAKNMHHNNRPLWYQVASQSSLQASVRVTTQEKQQCYHIRSPGWHVVHTVTSVCRLSGGCYERRHDIWHDVKCHGRCCIWDYIRTNPATFENKVELYESYDDQCIHLFLNHRLHSPFTGNDANL